MSTDPSACHVPLWNVYRYLQWYYCNASFRMRLRHPASVQ